MKPLQGNTPKDLSLSFPVLERVNHRVPSYPETPLSDIYLRCGTQRYAVAPYKSPTA